ncbi:hypothetical protein HAX54_018118, partial [Datura stramonium]|nr:hypothetical protein [Datura stramonium]
LRPLEVVLEDVPIQTTISSPTIRLSANIVVRLLSALESFSLRSTEMLVPPVAIQTQTTKDDQND